MGEDGLPSSLQLFPYGITQTSHGDMLVDDESLKMVSEAFNSSNTEYLPVDLDHLSVDNRLGKTLDERKSYGWFKVECSKEHGIVAVMQDWTDKGKELIRNKEYRYWSPVVYVDEENDNRITEIVNFALVHNPATKNQKPLINSTTFGAQREDEHNKKERKIMKVRKANTLKEFMDKNAVLFQEDGEMDPEVARKVLELLEPLAMSMLAEVEALKEQATKSEEEMAEKEEEIEEMSKKLDQELVNKLVASKKITPSFGKKVLKLSRDMRKEFLVDEDIIEDEKKEVERLTKKFDVKESPKEKDSVDDPFAPKVFPFPDMHSARKVQG